jgi:acyl carrier protein
MNTEDRLWVVFQDILELSPTTDRRPLAYNQTPKWNSLGHMSLVAAIETEFDIILETDDILAMSDFAKALEIVDRNL